MRLPKFLYVLSIILLHSSNINAQDTPVKEKFNPFIYNSDEFNYSLGLGGGLGVGKSEPIGVFVADLDVYHIYIGYRYAAEPIAGTADYRKSSENAVYFGYQYRNNIIFINGGAGFGSARVKCQSGSGNACTADDEGKFNSTAYKAEAGVIMLPYLAIGCSVNGLAGKEYNVVSISFNLKIGIFKDGQF